MTNPALKREVIAQAVKANLQVLCRCGCGQPTPISVRNIKESGVRKGQPLHCIPGHQGRIGAAVIRTHGRSYSPEYYAWSHIQQRCTNPKNRNWHNYGGRGITLCDKWRNSFAAFFEHVGPRPTPKHTIERIDNNGNYEPGNVKWATRREQSQNRRNNRLITFRGKTKCLFEWAREFQVPYQILQRRLKWNQALDGSSSLCAFCGRRVRGFILSCTFCENPLHEWADCIRNHENRCPDNPEREDD